MYSTCIFCHASLGANDAVEHFPVGRRLAFDTARGRLWAVCRKCERWNLSPLDERWEAIEECERLFSGTRMRVSTDNIGLARVADGLELVRIGSPLRPEMAAWRYGDQFGRRRTKHLVYTGIGVATVAGLYVLGPITGMAAGSLYPILSLVNSAVNLRQQRRTRAQIPVPDRDHPVRLRRSQLARVMITRIGSEWALRIPVQGADAGPIRLSNGRFLQASRLTEVQESSVRLTGPDALRAAALILPAVNAAGANRSQVSSAVQLMDKATTAELLFDRYAPRERPRWKDAELPGRALTALPREAALALEMATHEDAERRALEGELALLEDAWRHAEEIASISDDMFVPGAVTERLDELKRRDDP